MKKISITLSVILVVMLLCIPGELKSQERPALQQIREKIHAQKIGYFTDGMNLNPEESGKFWPVYNEYQRKKEEENEVFQNIYVKNQSRISTLEDNEIERITDERLLHEQRLLDIEKTYYVKFKEILPIRKVYKLYELEEEFKRILLNRIREYKNGTPPPPRKR